MTNEEKYKLLDAVIEASRDNMMGGKYRKAYESGVINAYNRLVEAVKALEQQPSEDCISRQAMLDGLARISKAKAKSNAQKALMGRTMFFTINLQPVTPQRPKGKWIEYEVDIAPHPLHCSLCGFSNHHVSNRYIREFRRCPNCGAEMSGGGEDGISN